MFDRSPPSHDDIVKLFLTPSAVPEGTFEIALVLGGTVSAGAYTAGALDFLIEALDCFEAARDQGDAPDHRVVVKVIVGTSGGGVNAAIASRALAYRFPPATAANLPALGAAHINPFYDVWVNRLPLARFLETGDVGKTVPSLLNGTVIDDGAAWVASYASDVLLTKPRAWVGAPLTTILTVTNVCGVPIKITFDEASKTETFVDHADHVRFAVCYPGQAAYAPRPDEYVLGFGDRKPTQVLSWDQFSCFARATAAFPLGFPTRQLARPLAHYKYRVVAVPPGPIPSPADRLYRLIEPDWEEMTGETGDQVLEDYHFSAVDGGATDNEPIKLARTALAGLLGRNPRGPDKADRAVLLIDPFAGKAPVTAAGVAGIVATGGATLTTFMQQTRYDTSDLLLAADETVFSRFMLTPHRDNVTGTDAIASGGLGAFIGFACPAFMRHDFLLGRWNCQRFLEKSFRLGGQNKLFARWSAAQRGKWIDPADGTLPIIPLYDDAAVEEMRDPWPKGRLNPEDYREAIERRFRRIVELEAPSGVLGGLLGWAGAHIGQNQAADYIIEAMKKYLKDSKLA
jgi:hypothetical protein